MLTQNFKTAAELNLKPKVYEGLTKVLYLLEAGDLIHIGADLLTTSDFMNWAYTSNTTKNAFNMRVTFTKSDDGCGTVGCIAGWAAYEAKMNVSRFVGITTENRVLDDLFYPPTYYRYQAITPSQAAQTLRYYLTTGVVDWSRVLGPTNCYSVHL